MAKRYPKAKIYFHQDLDGVTTALAMKKYLEDNQFEDGYQNGADLLKFVDTFSAQMTGILKDAGVKVVR